MLHILQHDKQMRGILKKAIDAEYILVVEAALKPYFQGQLIDHHMRFDHLFGDFLESEQRPCFLVPGQAYHSELALPQRLAHRELLGR